ncbi:MAG TPA: ATP-binding protein [Chitinispirillaceae bacterium]|nr:ATP-binding protein [Chitinispirillaceae bacterium]
MIFYSRNQVTIKVIDTGNGIPEEKQKHIFDKYYQISHKKGNTQGMGMGLYIVKGIVEGMGGRISLESDGKGTCFTVKLPSGSHGESLSLSDLRPAPHLMVTKDNPSVENTNIDCNKKTVLLVEDNRELILSMRESLIPEYNVLCASNGKDALDLLGKFNADLIVSDVMMDTMDGYELLKRVRENDQTRGIPFIFLTAKSGISEELKGLTSGAIDYIPKPFTMDLLKARIFSLLEYNALKRRAFELEKYRSVGMLTAGICHEILNPLSGIRGPLYVIEKSSQELAGTSDNTLTKSIGFIKENVSRIESIVNTMRSLFHGESFSVETIELHSFLAPIIEIFKNKTGENISYELNLPPGLEIKTNKGAFSRIIMNLLSNAVESIKENGKIRIEMDKDELVIRDSGCGIQKEQLSKIFDLAFTTRKESGGTGLGLYLVKELADRLSIAIDVRSEVGRGTEVLLGLGKHFGHEKQAEGE